MLNQIDERTRVALPDVVRAHLEALERENAQLQQALNSRVVIEQAKGVLSERLGLPMDECFELLRYAARSARTVVHDLAREIVTSRDTPAAVTIALARSSRWRAAHMREHAEHQRERARLLEEQIRATQERVAWKQADRRGRRPPVGAADESDDRVTVFADETSAGVLLERLGQGDVRDRSLPSGERVLSWNYVGMRESAGQSHDALRNVLDLIQNWVDEFGATQVRIGGRLFTMSPRPQEQRRLLRSQAREISQTTGGPLEAPQRRPLRLQT